jgi:uncharacterized membrane protein
MSLRKLRKTASRGKESESDAPGVVDGHTGEQNQPSSPAGPQRSQLWVIAALLIVYAALSQYAASVPDARRLGACLSIGPIFLIGIWLAWRWTRAAIALSITAAMAAILYLAWPMIERHYAWADLAQQCGAFGLVAAAFARSLFAGRIPLCTQLAEQLHGTLTPEELAYTRRATAAWSGFYGLLVLGILGLFFAVPLAAWSSFVNFGTFGLMILAGIIDHLVRRRLLPQRPGEGWAQIIRRALIG